MIYIKAKKILINSFLSLSVFTPVILTNNVEATEENSVVTTAEEEKIEEVFVDSNFKGNSDGSFENPFKTIEETVKILESDERYSKAPSIKLNSDLVYSKNENLILKVDRHLTLDIKQLQKRGKNR